MQKELKATEKKAERFHQKEVEAKSYQEMLQQSPQGHLVRGKQAPRADYPEGMGCPRCGEGKVEHSRTGARGKGHARCSSFRPGAPQQAASTCRGHPPCKQSRSGVPR